MSEDEALERMMELFGDFALFMAPVMAKAVAAGLLTPEEMVAAGVLQTRWLDLAVEVGGHELWGRKPVTADDIAWAEANVARCGWSLGDLLAIAEYTDERDELLDLAIRTGIPPADIAKALRAHGASIPEETP